MTPKLLPVVWSKQPNSAQGERARGNAMEGSSYTQLEAQPVQGEPELGLGRYYHLLGT